MKENHFAGTGKLLKLYLRRDRIVLPIWVLLALMVINGQVSLSIEGAILWRGLLQASITVMFGAALTMIRHTRTEEISGRNELILGRPVGKYANLSATLLLSCGGSLLSGLLVAVLLMGGWATPNISEAISFTLAKMNTWGAAIATLGNQEAFIAILIYILGLMAGLSVFAITMMQSMRQEEKDHYADMLLSRPVSRFKWMGSYLTIAFAGSALILLILGLASGIGWSIASGELAHISRVLGMSLFQELSIVPLIVLTVIAVALTWLGVIGFKRRGIG